MNLSAAASSIIVTLSLKSASAQAISGLAYNTSNLTVRVRKVTSSSYSVYGTGGTAMVTMTAGTYVSGGFALVGSGNSTEPTAEFGLPAAFVTSGVPYEVIVEYNGEVLAKKQDVPNLPAVDTSGRVNLGSIVDITVSVSGAGNITFVRGQSVASANLFPANFSGLRLVADPEIGNAGAYNVIVGGQSINAGIATSASISSLPGDVNTALTQAHGSGSWAGGGGGGTTSVVALPATARLPRGADNRRGTRLEMVANAGARIPLTVFDAFDVALNDLDTRILRFVVFDSAGQVVMQLDNADIDRDGGAVDIDPFIWLNADTTNVPAGQYLWQLWDMSGTLAVDLGGGVFVVRASALGA